MLMERLISNHNYAPCGCIWQILLKTAKKKHFGSLDGRVVENIATDIALWWSGWDQPKFSKEGMPMEASMLVRDFSLRRWSFHENLHHAYFGTWEEHVQYSVVTPWHTRAWPESENGREFPLVKISVEVQEEIFLLKPKACWSSFGPQIAPRVMIFMIIE